MKAHKFTILIAAFLISFSSCEKYLEVDPAFSLGADNYFNSEQDYELALIGAYDLLQGSYLTQWIGEIASDNSIAGGESVTDTEGLHQIDNMTHDGVNNELRSILRFNYAGVTRCNYIMENKDKTDFDGKEIILGETRFLRAYYYFELVRYFGGVPLVIDRSIGSEEVTTIGRASKAEIYAQIESDLEYAVANLNWSQPVKGRATKGAALALLGKVYLFQNKFADAATVLDRVINEGNYSLMPNYEDLWLAANENNSETVFDVEYSALEGGSYDCLICLEGNAAAGFNGIRQYEGPFYADGNSYNLPTSKLYNSFSVNDLRRDLSILHIDSFISIQADPGSISYATGGGGHTGYYNNKYIKRQAELGLPDDDLTSPLNYKVIRYADVLLMAAEAHNRNGNDGQALTYVNLVRARANMSDLSATGTLLTEQIWAERNLELAGEGHRFFDLVRTGKAADEIDGFQTGKHELFPLPQVEIDLSGGSWTQNPGY
ncbi:MAG: RagB/SusD family nutrient uptake outer membrane protein [Croceimicrobium sp.]